MPKLIDLDPKFIDLDPKLIDLDPKLIGGRAGGRADQSDWIYGHGSGRRSRRGPGRSHWWVGDGRAGDWMVNVSMQLRSA